MLSEHSARVTELRDLATVSRILKAKATDLTLRTLTNREADMLDDRLKASVFTSEALMIVNLREVFENNKS